LPWFQFKNVTLTETVSTIRGAAGHDVGYIVYQVIVIK